MSRFALKFFLLVIALLALPCIGHTRPNGEKYTIDLQDISFRSNQDRPAVLHLKQELKNQYPRLDLSTLHITKVILLAKSRQGHGQVRLRVGDDVSHAVNIPGNQKNFQDPRNHTFQRVVLENSSADDKGVWQLLLAGHIIAREVTLVLERSAPAARFALQNLSWATSMEGERRCGSPSSNARDGWDARQNICSVTSAAVYVHGYGPERLFVRPDINSIRDRHVRRVTEIEVVVKAVARNRSHHGHESATFGIEIGNQNYKSSFSLAPNGTYDGEVHSQTLRLRGSWQLADIANSRMWIKADQVSADFKVQSLQLYVSASR